VTAYSREVAELGEFGAEPNENGAPEEQPEGAPEDQPDQEEQQPQQEETPAP
jgi:hypothetical protein